MKERIKEFSWIILPIVVIVFCVLAYKIVDDPEKVNGAEDPYSVPQEVVESAEKWGSVYHISPEFLEAVAWAESRYNPNVSNPAGTCHGLMQIKYTAHSHRMNKLGVTSLFNLDGNMAVAADYFYELFEQYEDPQIVLGVYHGEGDALTKIEPSSYTKGILEMAEELEYMHGKKEIEKKAHFDPATVDWENGVG